MSFREKVHTGAPLRVLFVNDLGFQFGAGVATRRQIQSFVRRGDVVMGLCCAQTDRDPNPDINQPRIKGEWLGFHTLGSLGTRRTCSDSELCERVCTAAAASYPDLIIVGNLHSAGWPVSLVSALRILGAQVVTYLHDCHFLTGRCAYSGGCTRYLTGCDEQCPTPNEYPRLAPKLIHPAWLERHTIFGTPNFMPLVANSHWTQSFASEAIPGARVRVVHYGIDTDLFCPAKSKIAARRLLGIPENKFIVLGGAVNLQDARKGGAYLHELFGQLPSTAQGVVFGANSWKIPGAMSIDLLFSQRKIRTLYQAADLFVNTSLQEGFGQMMLEAAACGVPIVAFRAGGVADVSRDGQNAILITPGNTTELVRAVKSIIQNPVACAELGCAGRQIAVQDFSLQRQAENWTDYLKELASNPSAVPLADSSHQPVLA